MYCSQILSLKNVSFILLGRKGFRVFPTRQRYESVYITISPHSSAHQLTQALFRRNQSYKHVISQGALLIVEETQGAVTKNTQTGPDKVQWL